MNSDKSPTFSVIMPVFNKAPHIDRAIRSVLQQSYASFELIVIDDASTDNSLEEVEKFDDLRIRLLHRDTPGPGGYAARNKGIASARGDWIAFLDADDKWYSTYLQGCVDLAEQFPDCSFLSCSWEIKSQTGITNVDRYSQLWANREAHSISFSDYLNLCINDLRPTHTCVVCIRNNEFALNLFPEGRAARGGDQHAWAMYMAHCKKMAWSPTVGATYYKDTVNMVTSVAPSSPVLALALVKDFGPYVNQSELQLLKKYTNRRMFREWLIHKMSNSTAYHLASVLYWKGDFQYCFSRSLLSLLPSLLVRRLVELKNTR